MHVNIYMIYSNFNVVATDDEKQAYTFLRPCFYFVHANSLHELNWV